MNRTRETWRPAEAVVEPRGPRAPGTGVSGGSLLPACPSPGHGHPALMLLRDALQSQVLPHQSDIQDSEGQSLAIPHPAWPSRGP